MTRYDVAKMHFLKILKIVFRICILGLLLVGIASIVTKLNATASRDIPGSVTGIAQHVPLFKVAIMSDVEDDWESLGKALDKAKAADVRAVFFLGDLTSYGDLPSLTRGKKLLDDSGIEYYVLPGDHDLAASVDADDFTGHAYFRQVFNKNYHTFTFKGISFILLDNSANFTQINKTLMDWFLLNLTSADYVLLSQPLYHPAISRVMGLIDGKKSDDVYNQGQLLLEAIRKNTAMAIIAGDHHVYSKSVDPVRRNLSHIVTGALTSEQNFGSQEFLIMSVFEKEGTTQNFSVERVNVF